MVVVRRHKCKNRIIEDVKGGTAQFSDDGRSLVCTGSVAVRIRFRMG